MKVVVAVVPQTLQGSHTKLRGRKLEVLPAQGIAWDSGIGFKMLGLEVEVGVYDLRFRCLSNSRFRDLGYWILPGTETCSDSEWTPQTKGLEPSRVSQNPALGVKSQGFKTRSLGSRSTSSFGDISVLMLPYCCYCS